MSGSTQATCKVTTLSVSQYNICVHNYYRFHNYYCIHLTNVSSCQHIQTCALKNPASKSKNSHSRTLIFLVVTLIISNHLFPAVLCSRTRMLTGRPTLSHWQDRAKSLWTQFRLQAWRGQKDSWQEIPNQCLGRIVAAAQSPAAWRSGLLFTANPDKRLKEAFKSVFFSLFFFSNETLLHSPIREGLALIIGSEK